MNPNYTIYTDFLAQLQTVITNALNTMVSAFIGNIAPSAILLFTVYVAGYGWMMWQGLVQEPLIDGARRVLKLGVINGIALSVGAYNTWVVEFTLKLPQELAAALLPGSTTNASALDGLLNQGYAVGNALWQQGGITNPGPSLQAILAWAVVIITTAYGGYLFALSMMAIAGLLAIGPLFILLLLFESTKRYFVAWVGQISTYMFVQVLTVVFVGMLVYVINQLMGQVAPGGAVPADLSFSQCVILLASLVLSLLLLMQVPSMAHGLGGGAHLGTGALLQNISGRAGRSLGRLASERGQELRSDANTYGRAVGRSLVRGAGHATGVASAYGKRGLEAAGVATGEALRGVGYAASLAGRAIRKRFNWSPRRSSGSQNNS